MVRVLAVTAPFWLVVFAFVALMRSGTPAPLWRSVRPQDASDSRHCNWYCHNHGCRHASRLPDALSKTLFDWTVVALHRMGDRVAPGQSFAGYRAVNLFVFCLAWPAGMYGLYLVALRQRRKLRGRR